MENVLKVGERSYPTKILITPEELQRRVQEMAAVINQDQGNAPLVVLIVLHGALFFATDLLKGLSMPLQIETVRIKSYDKTVSKGIHLLTPLPTNLAGQDVLIIEDIVDTGKTITFLLEEIQKEKPRSVKVCTLLDKPDGGHQCILDYVGFTIENHFVFGYGLDLFEYHRNVPYVGYLVR